MDERGGFSPSFIFRSASILSLSFLVILSASTSLHYPLFSLNVRNPRRSVFSSPTFPLLRPSVRRNCRYQTLVCSLITTPPASFLLRSFGLTTISSIVTREKNWKGRRGVKGRPVSRPGVVCSRSRWSYNIPDQGENLGKVSIKEELKNVRRQ